MIKACWINCWKPSKANLLFKSSVHILWDSTTSLISTGLKFKQITSDTFSIPK